MSVIWTALLILLHVSAAVAAASGSIRLKAGAHDIVVEVAETYEARTAGLMERSSLPPNGGMLFVYPELDRHCMWMRNTTIPLSVAFVDGDGAIVNTAEMEPGSDTRYCADGPVLYVLEMEKGWFDKRGVGPGTVISGLNGAPPGR